MFLRTKNTIDFIPEKTELKRVVTIAIRRDRRPAKRIFPLDELYHFTQEIIIIIIIIKVNPYIYFGV